MSEYLMARLPAQMTVKDVTPHLYTGQPFDLKSNAVNLSRDNIESVVPTDSHGQQGFVFSLRTPVSVTYVLADGTSHTISTNELQVQLGDLTTNGTTPVIAVSDVLVKVGWNYHLIHRDASHAVHNPIWVNQVLDTSIEALFPGRGVGQQ